MKVKDNDHHESSFSVFERVVSKLNSTWGIISTIIAIFLSGYGIGAFVKGLSNKYDMLVKENEYREQIQDLKAELTKKEIELQIHNLNKDEQKK